jgi:chromosome partitioning protein
VVEAEGDASNVPPPHDVEVPGAGLASAPSFEPEHAVPEQVEPEHEVRQVSPQAEDPGQVDPEREVPRRVDPEPVLSGQVAAEPEVLGQVELARAVSGQVAPEREDPGQVAAERAVPEQVGLEGAVRGQVGSDSGASNPPSPAPGEGEVAPPARYSATNGDGVELIGSAELDRGESLVETDPGSSEPTGSEQRHGAGNQGEPRHAGEFQPDAAGEFERERDDAGWADQRLASTGNVDEAESSSGGLGATGGVGSGGVDEDSAGPVPDASPWREPALPMALPPPIDLAAGEGESGAGRGLEAAESVLPVQLDPTWPSLFPGQAAAGAAQERDDARPLEDAAVASTAERTEAPLPADPGTVDVSRETLAADETQMPQEDGEAPLEDEAVIAVREAISRAVAEAGVDVSRETSEPTMNPDMSSLEEPQIDIEAAARNARVTFRIRRDALNGSRRVLAVANQKGGVGKSTTAVNLSAYLALAGAKVLVVDLDPQGNASTGLGLDHRDIEPSIYDVLTGEASPAAAIRATGVANLHVLPSTIDLAGAEVELVSAMSRETRLRRALGSIGQQYDTVFIDCPPSLGLLTVNALAAADELLIPIQCEYYALEGLGQLLRNVELVRANLNPELRIGGIVLTMYDGRTRLALQVVDEVRKHFSEIVYQTVVPRSVRLSEAPGYGLPIALYDPLSRGGIAYRDLAFELAERSGLLAPTGEGAS